MVLSFVLGLAAGLVATLVMTALMVPMMGRGPGVMQLAAARLTRADPTDRSSMMGGMGLHFIYGTIMGGIYAIGSTGLNLIVLNSHLVNSLLFGLLLFIVAVFVVMPLA